MAETREESSSRSPFVREEIPPAWHSIYKGEANQNLPVNEDGGNISSSIDKENSSDNYGRNSVVTPTGGAKNHDGGIGNRNTKPLNSKSKLKIVPFRDYGTAGKHRTPNKKLKPLSFSPKPPTSLRRRSKKPTTAAVASTKKDYACDGNALRATSTSSALIQKNIHRLDNDDTGDLFLWDCPSFCVQRSNTSEVEKSSWEIANRDIVVGDDNNAAKSLSSPPPSSLSTATSNACGNDCKATPKESQSSTLAATSPAVNTETLNVLEEEVAVTKATDGDHSNTNSDSRDLVTVPVELLELELKARRGDTDRAHERLKELAAKIQMALDATAPADCGGTTAPAENNHSILLDRNRELSSTVSELEASNKRLREQVEELTAAAKEKDEMLEQRLVAAIDKAAVFGRRAEEMTDEMEHLRRRNAALDSELKHLRVSSQVPPVDDPSPSQIRTQTVTATPKRNNMGSTSEEIYGGGGVDNHDRDDGFDRIFAGIQSSSPSKIPSSKGGNNNDDDDADEELFYIPVASCDYEQDARNENWNLFLKFVSEVDSVRGII